MANKPEKFLFLVGNPNTGKTTIFNILTGQHAKVGNWPGVTIERREGRFEFAEEEGILIDLPGTYSMNTLGNDEKTVGLILDELEKGIVLNVVDAGNLERNLVLTLQMMEMGIVPIVIFNCSDELKAKGFTLDSVSFEALTGCKCILTNGRTLEGFDSLRALIAESLRHWNPRRNSYSNISLDWVKKLSSFLAEKDSEWKALSPAQKLKKLANLDEIPESFDFSVFQNLVQSSSVCWRNSLKNGIEFLCFGRFHEISRLLKACLAPLQVKKSDENHSLDRILLNKWLAFPIFFTVLGIIFWTTFSLGKFPSSWIGTFLGNIAEYLRGILPKTILTELFLDGVWAGISGVLVFLPNILILFFCLVILEDSGYLARGAFLLDRVMAWFGFQGRAFVLFLMGIGCNVPALLASKMIESPVQRIRFFLLIPLVACSARLPILTCLVGIFFPSFPGLMLFFMFFLNFLVVAVVAMLLFKIWPDSRSDFFLLELPPYRIPSWRNFLPMFIEKIRHFLEKAGTVILLGTIVIWVLNYFPQETEFSQDFDIEISKLRQMPFDASIQKKIDKLLSQKEKEKISGKFLARFGKAVVPLFEPLGFGWREAVSLIPGFLAKESIVSTLTVLYSPVDGDLGAAMKKEGMTAPSALSLMLFSIFYVPCLPTLGMIYRESKSFRITLLALIIPGMLAWCISFFFYRIAIFCGF